MGLTRQLDTLRSTIDTLTIDSTTQQHTIQSLEKQLIETLTAQRSMDQQCQQTDQRLTKMQEEKLRLVEEINRLSSTELAQRLHQVGGGGPYMVVTPYYHTLLPHPNTTP